MKRIGFVAASATAWIVATAFVLAQGDGNRVAVPFSDPSRAGTVEVNLFQGSIRVTAWNGRDVVVSTDDTIVATREGREITVPQRPEPAGLRRLTQRTGVRIEEANNVMSIGSGRFVSGEDVTIQVPVRTNLNLSTLIGDVILVEGVEGEIEVTSTNGEITLRDVAGTVVAHAMNGDMRVTLRQVTPEKPMSFTSFNGSVDVTLPSAVKANMKLRSDQGEVYTDFDVQIQQQRTTSVAPNPVPVPPTPPLPPLPPGADARERERQVRERARQARERARQVRERTGTRFDMDTAILGTVNGGGPEFELRTFNGDIYLRKGR